MDEVLSLPVSYKGEEHEFLSKVAQQRYAPRFIVTVDNVELVYERDDAGELRAGIYNEIQIKGKLPEQGLIEAISAVIQHLIQ